MIIINNKQNTRILKPQNLKSVLIGKWEINNMTEEIKNIINVVEAFDLIVREQTKIIGKKMGKKAVWTVKFFSFFKDKFRAKNKIRLNFANSEGWKVKPKILIHLLASIGLLKSSRTYDGVRRAQVNNTIELINKINERLVKYL